MFTIVFRVCFVSLTLLAGAMLVSGQSDATSRFPGDRKDPDAPFGIKEMLAKQRVARDKKDYEAMLKRGDEALVLSKQLEASFEQNKSVGPQDRDKLVELERLVTKIREELGGGDDDDSNDAASKSKPSDLQQAFKSLQDTTVSLVDELKKTTRFTISAVAIQSSNSVLKIVRFLRLRK
jgi:hypothetical protein